jgi:hypothetical protein
VTTSDQALYQALAAFAALTELLGGGPEPRIYPVEAPEEAPLALLVYQKISSTPATTHGEGVTGEEHFDGDVYQLTALADTQQACAAILYQARLALEASTTLKGVQTDERALDRAEEADCHGRASEVRIWHRPDAA